MTRPNFIRFNLVVKHGDSKLTEVYPFDGPSELDMDEREAVALHQAADMARFVLKHCKSCSSVELHHITGDVDVNFPYFDLVCSDDFLIQAMDICEES